MLSMWNISISYGNWFLLSSLIVLDILMHRKSSIRAHIDLCRLANGPWLFVFVAVTSIKTPKHQMEKLILGFRTIRCPVAAAMHSIESMAHFTISHNQTPDEKEGTQPAGFTFFALIRARRALSLLICFYVCLSVRFDELKIFTDNINTVCIRLFLRLRQNQNRISCCDLWSKFWISCKLWTASYSTSAKIH